MKRLALFALSFVFASAAAAAIPPWVREAIPQTLPESTKKADAVVLLDDTHLIVQGAGEIAMRYRRVVRVQTSAGREHAYAAVHYDADTKLSYLRGWSIDANGNEYEVKERDAVETAAFDGEVFSDSKVKVLRIPGGDPGTIFAYEYQRRERPFLLQSVWHFQENIPVLRARLQLSLPDLWTYDARWANYKPVESVNATWDLRDIPAVDYEPRMPSYSTLAGRVGVIFIPPGTDNGSAQRSWNDLANWYAGLASSRLAPTAELQAKVRELAKSPAKEASIRALARFAQKDVRYVAIEIGIGGYQPHAAGDVFRNRYGDCKDKATLLKAMLKEIGIESHYVLVHTTRGHVDPQLPLLASFNHVILAIASPEKTHATIEHPSLGKLVLFDPTSTTTPYGYLPSYLQESRGLLVTASGGQLIPLGSHAPDANQLRRKATLALDQNGTLTGTVEEVRTGWIASEMRASLQSMNATDRIHLIERNIGGHLTNYSATGIAIENLEDAETDLVIRYGLTAKGYAKSVADMLLVRPRVLGQKPEAIVDLSERKFGYVTEGPSLQTDEVEIAVAPVFRMDELPAPIAVSTPLVDYASVSEFKDGVLRYKRKYALNTFFVPRESLPELNKSFSRILADERASAVFK